MKKNSGKIVFYVIALVAAALLIFYLVMRVIKTRESQYHLYIGGYGNTAVKCLFNSDNLEYGVLEDFKAKNPSFLALTLKGNRLYGVSESGSTSGVWGYANNGTETSLGECADGGLDPCHLALYRGYIFTANYGKGSISVFPLDTSGRIKSASQVIQFVPSTTNAGHGASTIVPRIHMVKVLKMKQSGRNYLLATDKGSDRIYFFRIEQDTTANASADNILGGKPLRLNRCDTAFLQVPRNYGPRHMEFSQDGRFMYLLCEVSCKVIVYKLNEENENILLKPIQEIISDRDLNEACADVHLSPDGRFLYTSNRRGRDGITIFHVNTDGTLERVAYQVTAKYPRSFAFSPDGEFLFVCCQKDKIVQIFRTDRKSGYLINTGKSISFTDLEPSCILVREI